MEIFKIENLSFSYPQNNTESLYNINLSVMAGEFLTICGKSGCGKTTLLRLLKTSLAPHGNLEGKIFFEKRPLSEISFAEQSARIGFVMQNPDNQLVTDKVWHELAFGLESLGFKTAEIRARVSEMASFFGIQGWFHKKVTDLSGGQKQLLNLASVMVMQPTILILDEPTSQLDPIAAQEFLKTLDRINKELGTTVILTEHRLEDALSISDRVIVIDEGRIIADGIPTDVGKLLKDTENDMYEAFPVPMRVAAAVEALQVYPMTVRAGRAWLEGFSDKNVLDSTKIPKDKEKKNDDPVIEVADAWFRYEKNLDDVLSGFNIKVFKGELFSILGGNGTGKSTALSLISGLFTPYRGKVLINGEKISKIHDLYNGVLGVLPQNPETLFVKKTVYEDLLEMVSYKKERAEQTEQLILNIAALCRIENLLESHPYDLSGGEKQRAALAKILLKNPRILLLDEPTKGMDVSFKECFADILADLRSRGVTIVMVSHDIEFCARFSDRCALMFDGNLASLAAPREFFAGKSFYTTAANRMARTRLPDAVLAEDIVAACGSSVKRKEKIRPKEIQLSENTENIKREKKISRKNITLGSVFLILFIITCIWGQDRFEGKAELIFEFVTIVEIFLSLFFFLPQKEIGIQEQKTQKRKLSKRTLLAALSSIVLVPITIFAGFYFLDDRKYYFISLLIILETALPFLVAFEKRKPNARELVLISVICAIAIAGRVAFFMLPQFKPPLAVVILAGVVFGGETGFLVGAVTGFVSNFFFGQGPWTPWQMFSFGIVGFVAGILFKNKLIPKTRLSLCVFGGFAALVFYGVIANLSNALIYYPEPNAEIILSSLVLGLPFDLIHAVSTVFFLWFLAEPMIDKLERVKIKYNLL